MAGHFAKFVNLARTPEELAAERAKSNPNSPGYEQPVYPYGLCICLDEDMLNKLKLDTEDCEVGAKIHLCCMAEVTDFSQRKMDDGVRRRIELQVTDIALENEDEENAGALDNSERMAKRYGIKADGGEEDDE